MYHRLILAMNFALLPRSLVQFLGTWPMPAGTPYFEEAVGTVETCTASGFIGVMFSMTVPIYYCSLALQAFLGIKHNFMEEKYKHVEKWIHIFAYTVPCGIALVPALTENINPSGAFCWVAKAPFGCETNPDVDCERGEDVGQFMYITRFFVIGLYFIFPPAVIASMYCWIGRVKKKIESSKGMQRIRESARKKMMQSIAKQVSLYLSSFWFTYMLMMIHGIYKNSSKELMYNLLIVGNVVFSMQGFIFAIVYFALQSQRIGVQATTENLLPSSPKPIHVRGELTVDDIRSNTKMKKGNETELSDDVSERFNFNVFDGIPDPNSPWAKFIDQDDSGIDEISDTHLPNEADEN